MTIHRYATPLLLLASSGFAVEASAATVALAPILGSDPRLTSGLSALAASELEFMPGLEEVVELREPPASLNAGCLSSPSCLGGIARAQKADQLVAGQVTGTTGGLKLDLVLFDVKTNKTIARRSFDIPPSADDAADVMPDIMRDLYSGSAKPAPELVEKTAATAAAAPPPEPTPAPRLAPPPPVDLDDFELGDEDPSEPVAAAKPITAATPAAPPPAEDDFDPDSISFGSASDAMRVEELSPTPTPTPEPKDDDDGPPNRVEQQEPKPVPSSTPPAAKPAAKPAPPPKSRSTRARPTAAHVTLRGGYSGFQTLGFVSGGAEAAVRIAAGLHAIAGLEVYAVNRTIPELLQRDGLTTEWNLLYPANAGLLYQFDTGSVKPYLGADGLFGSYYLDEAGNASVASGARARAGLDWMFTRNVGVNINSAVGAWTGKNWTLIEAGMTNTGLVFQGSGGVVVAF
jgi:hypothetical protein